MNFDVASGSFSSIRLHCEDVVDYSTWKIA